MEQGYNYNDHINNVTYIAAGLTMVNRSDNHEENDRTPRLVV